MLQVNDIDAVARLRGEPDRTTAAGVTREGNRLLTLENTSPFDPPSQQRSQPARQAPRGRLVIVAGIDGDDRGGRAALGAIEWFKREAPGPLRDRWAISALPLADPDQTSRTRPFEFPPQKGFFEHPEQPESRYAWRWATYQAPDLLLEIRGADALSRGNPPAGSLAAAMAGGSEIGTVPVMFASAGPSDGPAVLQQVLREVAAPRVSEIHATLSARVSREPTAIARVLADRYPQNPIVSYIPSVAWANTLRLADRIKDDALERKVMEQVRPWLSRERPLFGERIALTAVAGTMIYADLAQRGEDAANDLAVQGAEAALRLAPSGFAQHGNGWTDDMFMISTILARSGRLPGRERDLDHLAATLISYAGRLQREDGIFVHFTDGRVPWGRGNGFAALGLTEALTSLPSGHQSRAQVMEIYRRHMNGLKSVQAPDGMWRQVVDEPGSYREESVTAMTLTAMARGVRLGWLDKSYRPVIERAWRGLAAHITAEGGIVDICTSTGSGPTLRFYLDRTAVNGFDDRGGAMALLAATEMIIFRS
jgi:rhamnogalacturonyl hydrolase YesR